MAGSVIYYSGLITKTRAMRKNLLSQEQLRSLTELATVHEAVSFLRNTEGYGAIYHSDLGEWHRGQAEAMIRQVLWRDYEKLYRFSNASQREALEPVFQRYETNFLKECLMRLYQEEPVPLVERGAFFRRHACFPVDGASSAASLPELRSCLEGTPYARALDGEEAGEDGYAVYASRLDPFYYIYVDKQIRKWKPSTRKEILHTVFGTRIDWLNIMWVYRLKRFFAQREPMIRARLIPVSFRLKDRELTALIQASSPVEMNRILENTVYFKGKDAYLKMEDEISYQQVMTKTYQMLERKYPMSMAPVLGYLYDREQETEQITSVIEGIRYQIPPTDIRTYILLET